MAAEPHSGASDWIWQNCSVGEEDDRAYEYSLIGAVDAVRIGLVLVLFAASLTMADLVTSARLFSFGLFIGSLLSLWGYYGANWRLLRGTGQLSAGVAVLAVGDIAWLSLIIIGSGGLASPFAGLLVIPILYSVALFCRLKLAPIIIAGTALLVYVGLAAAAPGAADVVGGYLTTVVALAVLSYAVCQILERERRSNEVMMRELSEGIILLDGTGRIVAANRQIERLTGIPIGCMVGEQVDELLEDERYETLARILGDIHDDAETSAMTAREITFRGAGVTEVLCTTAQLPGLVGERIGSVVVCEDVTAIKSALRAREGEDARLQGELRSPTAILKVVSSMLGLLADDLDKEDHQMIVKALDLDARRLVANIAALMNVSSLEEPGVIANSSRTDVAELVRGIRRRLSMRAARRDITISEQVEELPDAHVDAARLKDALERLVDNALRHSPDGGQVLMTAAVEDDMLTLSVADRGPGVPRSDQSKIFGKFVQIEHDDCDTKRRGCGLGLYIVRRVARLHDGAVSVRNRAEGGAVFTLSVPLEPTGSGERMGGRSAADEDLSTATAAS